MRMAIFFAVIICSFGAFAKTKQTAILEVSFERAKKSHVYKIVKSASKKSEYNLLFTDEKRKTKSHRLSQRQAEQIKNEATRIIWENQYRKPASTDSCREYMTIKTDLEKSRICYENKASVGRAFGFINSLDKTIN